MEKYKRLLTQFLKYSVVGLTNTLIALVTYYTLVWYGLHYLAANSVAFLLGTLNSYYWNNRFVFKKTSVGHGKPLFRLFLGSGCTYLLGMGLLVVQVEVLGVSEYIAPVVNVCFTTGANFLISKLWVFK